MTELAQSPCFAGSCPSGLMLSRDEAGRNLCKTIQDYIVKAGGAGLLEITPCPYRALTECGPDNADPVKAELGRRLGVEAVWGGEE